MPTNGKYVTAQSSNQEIIDAINAAGESQHAWRKDDWKDTVGTNNTRSWVIANDIGRSTSKDKSLLKRLRTMVQAGLLEERCNGSRRMPINNYPCADTYVWFRGMPRFRVIPQ